MKDITNNIFDYATKELSLEAILRWSLEWIHYPEHELYWMAVDIMEKFGLSKGSYHSKDVDIYKQLYNIDILLILKNLNQAIIIELKTFTSEHGNQINRYRDKLLSLPNWELNRLGLKQKLIESDIKTVYFKIGFFFDCDLCVRADYMVNGRDFLNV